MNIANTPGVSAATSAAQDATAGAAQMLLLKKALDTQTAVAASLIQAIPQPALATEGMVGRNINTFA
jgi:hypothetical protein